MTSPFSKDYVSKIKIDHRDRKYKKPVISQPPADVHAMLNPRFNEPTRTEVFQRISLTNI